MENKIKSLIIGSILGDGYLSKKIEKKQNSYLSLQHSEKQLNYLIHKQKRLKELNLLEISKIYDVSRKFKAYRVNIYHKNKDFFNLLRHSFYPNNNKTLTRHLLNYLDAEGLAWWYMDDGSCIKVYKKSKDNKTEFGAGRYLQLCTHNFNYNEHIIMQNYFKIVWDISVKIRPITRKKDNSIKYSLIFNVENGYKLISIIEKYIISSMKYKIDFNYKHWSFKGQPNKTG